MTNQIERKAIYGQQNHSNNGNWDFHSEDTQEHLHAIHPYPARFIPQIPRKAILEWTKKGDIVLDPFCGSGTTILESILLNRPAIGVDNNAVATLITRAKTLPYTRNDIRVLKKFIAEFEQRLLRVNLSDIPKYKNIEYWFDDIAISDLSMIRSLIYALPPKPSTISLAILSSIIVKASHQDSDTRYSRIDRDYKKGSASKWFLSQLQNAVNRITEIIDLPKAKCDIYCADGRDLSFIQSQKVQLIVTSPPYINAYDYHKYHRHRLHWIEGDVDLARDVEIGKHDTFTRPNATPQKYFEDMFICFSEWHRITKHKGHVLIVIGDGIVSGKPVAVGDTLVDLCQEAGFIFVKRWIRNLHTGRKSFNQKARIDKEHLLLFTK